MAEKTLTKEEWEQVAKALSGYTGAVALVVDGRKVSFARGLVKKNQLGIMTYIDGTFEGAWLSHKEPTPETAFLKVISKFVWKESARSKFKKMSKRQLKQLDIDPDEKHYGRTPIWASASQIRRHYEKTFNSIELLEAI